MITVYDKDRTALGLLQNAFDVTETHAINDRYQLVFSLPREDIKNNLCQPMRLVRYKNGHLYRILPSTDVLEEAGVKSYQCEHVIMTLVDSIMAGYHKIGNIGTYTAEVINYVLDKQDKTYNIITNKWEADRYKKKNWVLGECDFRRQFEYAWENESILNALFSLPAPFAERYMWTYDTNVYPWVINLKQIDMSGNPQFYIQRGKNLVNLESENDPTMLCTRILPLGQGEGEFRLNIASVNNGVAYVQSGDEYINRYGMIEKPFEDQRYTDANSLKAAAEQLLKEYQEPYRQYQVGFAHLGSGYYDTPEIGKIVEIIGYIKTYVVGITFKHDEILESTIEIANKPQNLSSSFADSAERSKIDEAYSQGYTSLLSSHEYGNATPAVPLTMNLTIPSAITKVEHVMIDVSVGRFRYPFGIEAVNGLDTTTRQSVSKTEASSAGNTGSAGGGSTGSGGAGGTDLNETDTTGWAGGDLTSVPNDYLITSDAIGDGNVGFGGGGKTSGQTDSITGQASPGNTFDTTSSTRPPTGNPRTGEALISYMNTETGGTTTAGPHTHPLPSELEHDHNTGDHVHQHVHKHEMAHAHSYSHEHNLYAHDHPLGLRPHNHYIPPEHRHLTAVHIHEIYPHKHIISGTHTHPVSAHRHPMAHTHNYAHTHDIKQHDHELIPEITTTGNATTFTVRINSADRRTIIGTDIQQLDALPWLLNEQNEVPKNTRHTINIVPNDAAYVMLDLLVQGFANMKGEASA